VNTDISTFLASFMRFSFNFFLKDVSQVAFFTILGRAFHSLIAEKKNVEVPCPQTLGKKKSVAEALVVILLISSSSLIYIEILS